MGKKSFMSGFFMMMMLAVSLIMFSGCEKDDPDSPDGPVNPDGISYSAENEGIDNVEEFSMSIVIDGLSRSGEGVKYDSYFDLVGKKNGVEVSRERIVKRMMLLARNMFETETIYVPSFSYQDLGVKIGEPRLFKKGAFENEGASDVEIYQIPVNAETDIYTFKFAVFQERATYTKDKFKHNFKLKEWSVLESNIQFYSPASSLRCNVRVKMGDKIIYKEGVVFLEIR